MTSPKFSIPEKYASKLRFVEAKDHRSESEIYESLTKHVPIISEKNIWTYWHAGFEKIPSWGQRNIMNWVRLHGSDWTIRVLDTVPGSPNHALKWIAPGNLPESFVKGTMTGPYVGPHSADFLRGAALHAYGGIWMDVGSVVFRNMDDVVWKQLGDDKSPYTVAAPWMFHHNIANHFVAARKGDEFIAKWHALFLHVWEGKKDYTGVIESPLFAFAKDIKFSDAEVRGFKWDWAVDESVALGYVGQVLAWARAVRVQEPDGGFDGVSYWENKILLFDVYEDWPAEKVISWKGEDLLKVLTTPLDADPESEGYKLAEKAIWWFLTEATMQKITHGKHLTHSIHCGTLLDENEGADQTPGTFGELLRYGSIHFEQTRSSINYVSAKEDAAIKAEEVIHKRLLEVANAH